jgi:hypothetical protein
MIDHKQSHLTARLERERLSVDQEKNALEREKLALEQEKMLLEDRKLAVTIYLEDFKARWQELLNFENENNRWTTLYVTALLLVISWILNNSEKYNGLSGLYGVSDNAYFIMAIAIINALYTFAMAFKGYQIQQIAQYQYDFVAGKIWDTVHAPFNEWERYRREAFAHRRGPEPIRTIYYILISSLPTIVSYTIIGLYWYFEWRIQADRNHWGSFRNWFSIGSFAVVTCSLLFSWRTSALNKKWDALLQKTQGRVQRPEDAPGKSMTE